MKLLHFYSVSRNLNQVSRPSVPATLILITLLFLSFPFSVYAPTLKEEDVRVKKTFLEQEKQKLLEAKEAVKKNPEDVDAHYILGLQYQAMGKYQEAIHEYKEALRIDPTKGAVEITLADLYEKNENYIEAIKAYEKLSKRTGNTIDLRRLATLYNKIGKNQAAIATYQKIVSARPENSLNHSLLGEEYRKAGKHRKAISKFKEALRIESENPSTFFDKKPNDKTTSEFLEYTYGGFIAETFLEIKNYDEAILWYEKQLGLKIMWFRWADTYYNLGSAYNSAGRYAEAIVNLIKAEKLYAKSKNVARVADSRKYIRHLSELHGYKPEDFADVEIPNISQSP